MKTETLKKIVELADGFEWLDANKELLHAPGLKLFGIIALIEDKIVYPLLLRRAVEGWNKKNPPIDLNGTHLYHFPAGEEMMRLSYSAYAQTDYLTPQERAIEACLIELLED